MYKDKNLSIGEMRRIAQKAQDVKWALPARRVSIFITRLLLPINVTPNQITLFWGGINVFIALLLATGQVKFLILVPFMIQFYIIMDCVDGEIARLKGIHSAGGKKLEQFVHEIFDNLCIIGVTIGAFQQTHNPICWVLGLTLFFGRNIKERIEYIIRTSILLNSEEVAASDEEAEGAKQMEPFMAKSVLSWIISLLDYIPYRGLHIIVLLGALGQMFIALFIWTAIMNLRWMQKAIYWIRNMNQPNRLIFLVVPADLHQELVNEAGKHRISLSLFILQLLKKSNFNTNSGNPRG